MLRFTSFICVSIEHYSINPLIVRFFIACVDRVSLYFLFYFCCCCFTNSDVLLPLRLFWFFFFVRSLDCKPFNTSRLSTRLKQKCELFTFVHTPKTNYHAHSRSTLSQLSPSTCLDQLFPWIEPTHLRFLFILHIRFFQCLLYVCPLRETLAGE